MIFYKRLQALHDFKHFFIFVMVCLGFVCFSSVLLKIITFLLKKEKWKI